jgi:hypothetical protein
MDVEATGDGYTTVVFQGLAANGLYIVAYEGDLSDLYPFGGREEGHVGGVIVQRIHQAAFLEDEVGQAGLLCFQPAGDPDGASTYNDNIVMGVHFFFPGFLSG